MSGRPLLKFITCGSVDDGKSTLIGHMLYSARLLFVDQEKALELDSRVGSANGGIDYSLLLDGLMAEREQGITIDVAYRYFSTDKRSFIVADTPGHEEYTRNMAVGASYAELAIILIDASKGVLVQTKRHMRICSMMGIRHLVFAVNKMDLIGYSQDVFESITQEIRRLMSSYAYHSIQIIPVSATEGDNITEPSKVMSWYHGPALLPYLEEVDVSRALTAKDEFFMPVQRVCRPDRSFRGFQGQAAMGSLKKGEIVTVLPSRETAAVKRILVGDREEESAQAGQPLTIELDREIDISRGCVITKKYAFRVEDSLEAEILWLDDEAMVPGRNFLMKLGPQMTPATVTELKYQIDINSGKHRDAEKIEKNGIARCVLETGRKVIFTEFSSSRELGSFILIDRLSNATAACGVIKRHSAVSTNLRWEKTDISRSLRENLMEQKAVTLWFTGLSGSGKSATANAVEKKLFAMGKKTMLLDGDNVRMGLNRNLGFSETDRSENIRRIAEVSKLMNDAGLIVLTSFISPLVEDRAGAREIIGSGSFLEIYISTPIEECERRDIKGLYKKAREGKIPFFTGITSPYEVPKTADLVLDTTDRSIEDCAQAVLDLLREKGF